MANSYLGPLCKIKHDWNRTGKTLRIKVKNVCRQCSNDSKSEYRKNNHEKILAGKRKYHKENSVELARKQREKRKLPEVKKANAKYSKAYNRTEKGKAVSSDARKRWRANNPEKHAEQDRVRMIAERNSLSDFYIRNLIFPRAGKEGIRRMIPQELIEVKRLQVKIKRFIKQAKGSKNGENK
jgi:uncharacterized protein (DUF305 family)